MARVLHRLTPAKVKNAKPEGKLSDGTPRMSMMMCDGGGLYLEITVGKDGNVNKSWIFRYARSGEQKLSRSGRAYQPTRDMGLGSSGTFGLSEARERARACRQLLADGIDPISHRDAARAGKLAEACEVLTFDRAAEQYIEAHSTKWVRGHTSAWLTTLRVHVSPKIGAMPVDAIDTPAVLRVLKPIWSEMPVTAMRVRGRIERVLAWATVHGHRAGDNPAAWKGHLKEALPAPRDVRKVKRQPALPYAEMPEFMAKLRARTGIAAMALQFTILTAVRTHDVLHAKRADIDRQARRWTIKAFSKTGKEHRVPLSDAALAVIDAATAIGDQIGGKVASSEYLFVNDVTGAPLSRDSMRAVLVRMGRKGAMTTHGCRASFKTWAAEETEFAREVSEMALGHSVGSAVEQAYMRGSALQKRVAIMTAWANFLGKPQQTSTVIPLQGRSA
jgi:integrase